MNKLVAILALTVLGLSAVFIRPALSHEPVVLNVVPRDVGGATHLNITIWHDQNSSIHHVETIEVTNGANTTFLGLISHPLEPDGTFTIDYNMGPISGTPAIDVNAECTITGWSSTPWTGEIPEFPFAVLLPLFMFATLLAAAIIKKR